MAIIIHIFSGSRPDNFIFGSIDGISLVSFFWIISEILLICSGVVPQQPPIILTIFSSIIVLLYFNYGWSAGGGFYYSLSEFLFKNNILVYIFFPIAFYVCNQILELNKINNLILFILLIIIEVDGHFYMESYDPLFYILIFTLFDLKITKTLFNNLNQKIYFIFFFQIFLLATKIFQLYVINQV